MIFLTRLSLLFRCRHLFRKVSRYSFTNIIIVIRVVISDIKQ